MNTRSSKARIPDQAFRRLWGETLGITDWSCWVLAPGELNFTQAAAWARGLGSPETMALSSGNTLVRLPWLVIDETTTWSDAEYRRLFAPRS